MYLKSCNCLQELHQRHTMCTGEPRSRQHNLQKGDSEARHPDTQTLALPIVSCEGQIVPGSVQ